MILKEVVRVLKCKVICGSDRLDTEVLVGCGADLMSDVLSFIKPNALLLTGLSNSQSVLTADVADVKAIVYVRGKRPDKDTLELAHARRIPILSTQYLMFEACGKLYAAGLSCVGEVS